MAFELRKKIRFVRVTNYGHFNTNTDRLIACAFISGNFAKSLSHVCTLAMFQIWSVILLESIRHIANTADKVSFAK